MSLAVAAAAAGLILAVWRAFQTDEVTRPHLRTIQDVQMEWLCEQGHLREGFGDVTPKPCWKCGQDSYPVAPYRCPVHGTRYVMFRFRKQEDEQIVPTELRAVHGEWEPFAGGPHCPICRRPMTREVKDPLEREPHKPARRDGH